MRKTNLWAGRLGLICLFAGLLVVLCSGCGLGESAPEPVTIRFAHREDDIAYFEALAPKFDAQYPHITVELIPLEGDGLNNLRPGDVDVLVVTEEIFGELWDRGGLLDLDPFIVQERSFDLADFYPGTVDLFSAGGKTWAIPAGVDLLVMYFNQDLFDRHRVPYPEIGWTWHDFLNTALLLREADSEVFGYAPTGGVIDPLLFVYQHGGRVLDDLQNPTRTEFDDPLTIGALEWYADLFHEHDVAPTPEEALRLFGGPSQFSAYRGIIAGKVGMWRGSLAERGGQWYWPMEWTMTWGMVPLPRDAQAVTGAYSEAYAISSETQQPEASWQWIAFLSGQMTERLMPARRSLAESVAFEQQVGGNIATASRASIESAVLVSSRRWAEFGRALDIFDEAVAEIVSGDATPQEAMEQAQRRSGY